MLGIFLLLAATICTGIFYFLSHQKNPSQSVNRYRKKNKNIRTQIVRSAQAYSTMRSTSDDLLGKVPTVEVLEPQKDMLVRQQSVIQCAQDDEREMDADVILGLKNQTQATQEKVSQTVNPPKPSVRKTECIVSLYLVAPEHCVYAGYELLQALLSAGLRFGQHRIFHRHAHKDGRGDILFHCASATEPGTFDLTKMGAFTSRGLCLFFSANAVADPMRTFDYMLETVDQLIDDLGGQVLDEYHEVLTKEKMINLRQRIRAFENSTITADMFS